jgi:beta-lactamase class A
MHTCCRRKSLLNRRTLLSALPALIAWPALAREDAPPALAAYERDTGGRVGLYAESLATRHKIVWRADERFVMCSTFKASLAAMVLALVDRGQDDLQQMISYGPQDVPDWWAPVAKRNLPVGAMSVADMCGAAVEYSDNTCANLLLARIGGPAALTTFWRSIGDRFSRLDHNEPVLNRSPPGDPHDTTTPAAMAASLRRLLLGNVLSPVSRERLIGWMVDCKTGDDRLRGGIPKGWRIADKTGNNGKDASGDIAMAWPKPDSPVLICLCVQGGAPSTPQIEAVFADIGRMVGEQLG